MTVERTRWAIVWLMVGAGVVTAFQVGKMPASIPHLQRELGMTLVEAGVAVAIFNAVGCLVGVVAGAFADVMGARRVVFGGMLFVGLASLTGALVDNSLLLLVTRFAEGLGAIGVFVSGTIIILRATRQQDHRQAFAAWGTYMPGGVATMVALTPFLLMPLGWRGVWVVNAALLASFALFFWWKTKPVPDPPSSGGGQRIAALKGDLKTVLRAPGPWLLGCCFSTYTGNYLCVTAFLPVYFIDRLNYAPLTAALLTALIIMTNVGGNLTGGFLAKKGVPRWLLIAISSATMGGTTIGIYATGVPPWLPFVLALCFSFVGGFLPASVHGGIPHYAPSARTVGTTGGLVVQIGNFGQLACPPILAAIVAVGGWQAGPWFTAGLGAAGVLFALAIRILEPRLTARPAPEAPGV